MINSTIDNALIQYVKTATGINKVIWAYPNAPEETPPYVVITLINIQNANGVRSESGDYAKTITVRFDVFTADDTHLMRANDLVDELDNEDTRITLEQAGLNGIKEMSDPADVTFIDKAYYQYRAFVDIRFGAVFTRTYNYTTIERVSGTILDVEFDERTEDYTEEE